MFFWNTNNRAFTSVIPSPVKKLCVRKPLLYCSSGNTFPTRHHNSPWLYYWWYLTPKVDHQPSLVTAERVEEKADTTYQCPIEEKWFSLTKPWIPGTVTQCSNNGLN
ncbi:hypothetical protein [Algoriphagus lutimaris]|uniref:hypothetical protein n=1 Tax=Algoriphagus lutimaris TaxID=613197 RepID=UPI001FAFA39C|nr:hypothetical protein [Algoriphagus lutimaris]